MSVIIIKKNYEENHCFMNKDLKQASGVKKKPGPRCQVLNKRRGV